MFSYPAISIKLRKKKREPTKREEPPEGTPRVTDMSWGTRCGTGLPARNSPMVGTSVPVPGILSHDISFHTHLPGLSIVLGFNLQHRMGRWSQEGSVRHVGGSLWHPRLCLTSGSPLDSKFLVSYVSHTWNPRRTQRWMSTRSRPVCPRTLSFSRQQSRESS